MDIGSWLRQLGLERIEAAFRDNTIDEEVLRDLTEDPLPRNDRLKNQTQKRSCWLSH